MHQSVAFRKMTSRELRFLPVSGVRLLIFDSFIIN